MLYRLLGSLPFGVIYAVAFCAYLVLYYVTGYRKEIVRDNLRHAFPDKNGNELTVLAKKFYRQLADVALEIIKARSMRQCDFRQRVSMLNPGLLRELSHDFQQSVIIVTLHQGNWEWMLHGASADLGIPLDPIYKPLHNRSADKLMREIRSRFGARPLAQADAARDILRQRRQFRLLVMVADQSPTRSERSVWTTFLHREAAFHPGPGTLARLTGFPVVFAQCRRPRRGFYSIEFHPLAQPPYGPDAELHITEAYARLAEQAIREEPDSWLWSNRRWKRQRERSDDRATSSQ